MKKRTTKIPGQVSKAIDRLLDMGSPNRDDALRYIELVITQYNDKIHDIALSPYDTPDTIHWKTRQAYYFHHVINQLTFIQVLLSEDGTHWESIKLLANHLEREFLLVSDMLQIAAACIPTCQHHPSEFGEYYYNDLVMSLAVESEYKVHDKFWPPFNPKLIHA